VLLIERRLARCGLSPTEARSVGGPEFIGVVTEAREEFCLTTPGAPASARHSGYDQCRIDRRAQEISISFVFGAAILSTKCVSQAAQALSS